MARENQIIRTADICDNHHADARICETQFKDVGGRRHIMALLFAYRPMKIILGFGLFLLKAELARFLSLMAGDHSAGRYVEEILLKKLLILAGRVLFLMELFATVMNLKYLILALR